MKSFALAVIAVAALVPAATYALQTRPAAPRPASPLAFVSLQRILTESAAAKASNKELEDLRKAKADDVAAKKKALDATRLALANAGGMFAASKRAELQATAQKQEADLKQATEEAQKSFLDLQRKLQTDLRTQLGHVLDDLARDQSVQYIFNSDSTLVWARSATDLTPEVLSRMNGK